MNVEDRTVRTEQGASATPANVKVETKLEAKAAKHGLTPKLASPVKRPSSPETVHLARKRHKLSSSKSAVKAEVKEGMKKDVKIFLAELKNVGTILQHLMHN